MAHAQSDRTIDQLMAEAAAHRRAGRAADAEPLYRKVLSQAPKHPDALHELGLVVFEQRRADESIDLIRRAMEADATRSDYPFNLGSIFMHLDRRDEAIRAFQRALALRSDFAEAAVNLGTLLAAAGRGAEAVDICRRALTAGRLEVELTYNMAVALQSVRRLDEAAAAYRKVLSLRPDQLTAWNNLGITLQLLQRPQEAEAAYRRLIALQPNAAHAHLNLGEVLRLQGRTQEAIAECRRAVELSPNMADAYYNLGLALRHGGDLDGAVEAYRRAVAIFPDYAIAYNNMGNALKDMGRLSEAIDCFRRAVTLRSDQPDNDSNWMLAIHYSQDYDLPAIIEELKKWNQRRAVPVRKEIRAHTNDRDPHRRLRVGYVSADFRYHACAFFLDPLLRNHDHQSFEIYLYSQLGSPDSITPQFQSYADHWRVTIGKSDDEMAEQIRRDGIDILVDTKLHCSENRLMVFARKPAPIQVSWLGYPGSSGLETMDYRITDRYLEPNGSVYPFAEQPIYLPDCFWSYGLLSEGPPVGPLPALSMGHITFGSLNNFCKINDRTLRVWAAAIHSVPGSRLLVLAPQGSARPRFQEKLQNLGVNGEIVQFIDHLPREVYLSAYNRIDIGLDTLPYNGHTTSLDALWMGVPVVTLPGDTPPGRVGLTHAMNLNLPQLVADSEENFAKTVANLAADLTALARLRESLRQRLEKSPLMDGPGFAKKMEAAYRRVWQEWCQKK
jgi:protein O-GlcNAc transferase